MFCMRIRVSVLISLILVLFYSCNTFTLRNDTPEWIWVAPGDSESVLYAVGGPSTSLEESRGLAMKSISSYVNTEVSSYYGSYSAAYFDDIKRTIAEKNSSWISSKSNSIIVGLKEIERWFDKTNDKWWVLLRIDKVDFEKSVKATADEVIRKRNLIEKNSKLAISIIERLLLDLTEYNFEQRLYSILECYQTISSFEYAGQLVGKIDGSSRLLLSFLENLANENIATISLTLENQPLILYQNTNNEIAGSITVGKNVDSANLIWNVIGTNNSVITTFKSNLNGEFIISIPREALSLVDKTIAIAPNLEMFGPLIANKFNMLIFTFPVIKYHGKYGFSIVVPNNEYLRENYKNRIQTIIYDQLGFNYIEKLDYFPMLKFIISQEISEQNQFLAVVQTLITVECEFQDGSKRIFQAPLEKGIGATPAKAKEESFNNSVVELGKSDEFWQFLNASI